MSYGEPEIKTRIPGPKSKLILDKMKKLNGGWSVAYPFVHSEKGKGCYFEDIDGNIFLDFGSQICASPLGYNHPELRKVLKLKSSFSPSKLAGQDFTVKEHLEIIEELLSICPKKMNAAFIVNSGAEAVENAIKIAMRKQKNAKIAISFESAFHGRTLGALSMTNSKKIHKQGYLALPMRRLPFNEGASEKLHRILNQENPGNEIAYVIIEPIQGEGGYRIASKKMLREIREITKQYKIPLICDEVQAGMGRTGEWWSHQHFGIEPEIISSAKALQVGATIANRSMFPDKAGAISSTWGGGDIIDMANGIAIIKYMKRKNLLSHISSIGIYLQHSLHELQHIHDEIQNIRGLGLMVAFDLPTQKMRDNVVVELLKRGVVTLGCGFKGIRIIPPYIVTKKEIDVFASILDSALKKCVDVRYKHKGSICDYLSCGHTHA